MNEAQTMAVMLGAGFLIGAAVAVRGWREHVETLRGLLKEAREDATCCRAEVGQLLRENAELRARTGEGS